MLSRKVKQPGFVQFDKYSDYFTNRSELDIDFANARILADIGLLPLYKVGEKEVVLVNDLDSIIPILSKMSLLYDTSLFADSFLSKGGPLKISPRKGTMVDILPMSSRMQIDPVFYAAARNLMTFICKLVDDSETENTTSLDYFLPGRVSTSSDQVRRYIERQKRRADLTYLSHASQFANTAYYMGSKRMLRAFLVEAIAEVLPDDGTVVDLMCGSGAASGAFNKVWNTIASDAQEFCTTLALVQGGGFSAGQAQKLLDLILPIARDHANILRGKLLYFLQWEDRILHGDTGAKLLSEYERFVMSFPTYPHGTAHGGWDPLQEVAMRKKDIHLYPYCLFVAYYANLYFGLRQSVEIDSLRYALDQVKDAVEKQWGMGALIATLSSLGTTYAGHFAQPVATSTRPLSLQTFSKILEIRSFSIIHEFSVRLLSLAAESERSKNPIEVIPGRWSDTMPVLDKILDNRKRTLVYLDAPYTREEYSRYYHILETIVSYGYPSCIGVGKIPDKQAKERFRSEFFTKDKAKFEAALVKIIAEVLSRGWICAWSYSDSGKASIVTVVEQVLGNVDCRARSFSVPYEHKSQGGKSPKKVIEYLVIFLPEETKGSFDI